MADRNATKVVHNKREPFEIYIGRPSKWGNPFSHKDGTSLRRGRAGWWNYCERHLYGRWVEDGKVMHWRMVPDGD